MPTTVTKTVKSSGGDYSSLSAWEAGQQGDLTVSDTIQQAVCYSFSDTTTVVILGWTTDSTRYIDITVANGEGHSGVFTTSKYNLSTTRALDIEEDYVRVTGLQLKATTDLAVYVTNTAAAASSDIRINSCICYTPNASVGIESDSGKVTYTNCIIYGCTNNQIFGFSGTMNFDNCTIVTGNTGGSGTAVNRSGATVTLRNCYVAGSTCYNGTITCTTCIHSTAQTQTGSTGSVAVSTSSGAYFTNVTATTEDYHIASYLSSLRGVGTDLSGTFTTDIDGQTRITPWDVGADDAGVITVTKTVKSSGGDYSSLSAWEAGQQSDLTANKTIRQAECYSFTDSTALTIDGWTTDSTRYIRIYTPTTERHSGTWDSSKYTFTGTALYQTGFDIKEEYTRVEGIQVDINFNCSCIRVNCAGSGDVRIINSLFRNKITGGVLYARGIYCPPANSAAVTIRNCIVITDTTGIHGSNTGVVTVQNCTSISRTNIGIYRCASTNCYAANINGGNAAYYTPVSTTKGASNDSSGTVGLQSIAYSTSIGGYFTNVTNGSENLIIGYQSSLRGQGNDLSATFTDDVAGNTRITPWDIGASDPGIITVTKTVKSAGGDYSSVSAWEAGQQADLTTTKTIRQAECYTFDDTTNVLIDGWTTGSTTYIRIYTATSERHSGVFTTSKFRMTNSSTGRIFEINEEYTRLEGLQLTCTGGALCMRHNLTTTSDVRVDSCILRNTGTGSGYSNLFFCNSSGGTITFTNCIAYSSNSSTAIANSTSSASFCKLDNCTIISTNSFAALKVTARNCYVHGSSGGFYGGTSVLTTCASSDSTGTVGLQNIAYSTSSGAKFVSTTSGSEDFHIQSGSGLINVGTDLSATFTTDIDGDTRPTGANTWDIGADELIAAAVTAATNFIKNMFFPKMFISLIKRTM